MVKADTNPDAFLSGMYKYQLRDKPSGLDKVVSPERSTTLILDALPAEKHSTTEIQTIRYPDLSLEKIKPMMKTIFINDSKRLVVTKRSQESNRRGRENG